MIVPVLATGQYRWRTLATRNSRGGDVANCETYALFGGSIGSGAMQDMDIEQRHLPCVEPYFADRFGRYIRSPVLTAMTSSQVPARLCVLLRFEHGPQAAVFCGAAAQGDPGGDGQRWIEFHVRSITMPANGYGSIVWVFGK